MNQMMQKLMQGDEEARRGVVQCLRSVPFDDAFPLLVQAMADESWRVRKEAVDIFVAADPGEQHISMLLELLRSEDNAGQRNSAAEAVSRLGSRALSSLVVRLHDPDADVRKFIIDVIGTIHCHDALQPLVEALDDQDINVASAAAEQLGGLGDGTAVPYLLDAIGRNEADFFRFNALAAIGKLATPAPVPQKIVELAANELLRKPVYECLGSIGDVDAVPVLLDGIATSSKSCRNSALVALYRIYQRSTSAARQQMKEMLQRYKGSDLVATIIDSFTANQVVRGEAILTILELIGDTRAASVLLQAFANDRLAERAIAAIKRLSPEIMAAILALYPASDSIARAAICMLCGECRQSEVRHVVSQGLGDSSYLVRQAAATAVGKLGLVECVEQLVTLLCDDEREVGDAAVASLQSLAVMHRTEIAAVAGRLARSEHPHLRRAAALLAAALGDNERLLLLAKDEASFVRQSAVSAMRLCRSADTDGILVMALVDEDPDVRIAAAEVIGATGSKHFAGHLVSALADDDVWVRCAILKSLVAIDPESGFREIKRLFPASSGVLLITELQLLEVIASGESYALIASAVEHQDRDVSSLASEIVARLPHPQEPA